MTCRIVTLETLVQRVLGMRARVPGHRAALVALSGIDGAGKGFVAERLRELLASHGLGAAVLGVDGWLNLLHVRFDPRRPAEHFYEHALRFEEMFERLVLPLVERRSLRLEMDFAEPAARSAIRRGVRSRAWDVEDTGRIGRWHRLSMPSILGTLVREAFHEEESWLI